MGALVDGRGGSALWESVPLEQFRSAAHYMRVVGDCLAPVGDPLSGEVGGVLWLDHERERLLLISLFDGEVRSGASLSAAPISLASIGDVDCDGEAEFCIGYGDRIEVFGDDLELEFVVPAPVEGLAFGRQAVAADLDQDGYQDLVVGAPAETANRGGRVFVFSLVGGEAVLKQELGAPVGYESPTFGAALEVVTAADAEWNPAGAPALVVGSPGYLMRGALEGMHGLTYSVQASAVFLFDYEMECRRVVRVPIEHVGYSERPLFGAALAWSDSLGVLIAADLDHAYYLVDLDRGSASQAGRLSSKGLRLLGEGLAVADVGRGRSGVVLAGAKRVLDDGSASLESYVVARQLGSDELLWWTTPAYAGAARGTEDVSFCVVEVRLARDSVRPVAILVYSGLGLEVRDLETGQVLSYRRF